MRIRNRRTGRRVELPQDDGLVSVVRWQQMPWGGLKAKHVLIGPDEQSQRNERLAAEMRLHDARAAKDRWGGNQWGEGWVIHPHRREGLEAKAPLLKTDLTLSQWRRVAA